MITQYYEDIKLYSNTLDKLIRMYQIAYGLNAEEFINRFWSQEIIDELNPYGSSFELSNILLSIESKGLDPKNKAIQKMAVCLGWSHKKTLRYFIREISRYIYREIAGVDKYRNTEGVWRRRTKPYTFIHPIYDKYGKERINKWN